jgi:hypothetical protein
MIAWRRRKKGLAPLVKKASEQVVAAADAFINPNAGVRFWAVLLSFDLDCAGVTRGTVGRTLFVNPHGNIQGIIASVVRASGLEGVQGVRCQVNGSSDWGAISHGCFSLRVMEPLFRA